MQNDVSRQITRQKIRQLVVGGADLNEKSRITGLTPLMEAVTVCDQDAVDTLLTHRADARAPGDDFGRTALHSASNCKDQVAGMEIAEALIRYGADLNAPDVHGNTPLICAVGDDSAQVASFFIQRGANVSVSNDRGETALHIAAIKGSVVVTKLLLQYGADVAAKDLANRTPAEAAVEALKTNQGHDGHPDSDFREILKLIGSHEPAVIDH